jgi:hypothetical protein
VRVRDVCGGAIVVRGAKQRGLRPRAAIFDQVEEAFKILHDTLYLRVPAAPHRLRVGLTV